MIIYKTTNLINGKIYIGYDTKENKYYYGSGLIIKHAFKKYGKKNFKKETLFTTDDFEALKQAEIDIIAIYRYFYGKENMYNITDGGSGNSGNRHTKETREKMSWDRKGKKHPLYGKKHSIEAKNKMSKKHTGKVFSKEHCENMSKAFSGENNPRYGKEVSAETRKKISETKTIILPMEDILWLRDKYNITYKAIGAIYKISLMCVYDKIRKFREVK